ncbi:MAG: hypothetical protein IJL79_01405 [Candidatus Methanomethylophilaceae archaeon]|nr:hypothetical protein [Candidatus Methanomethylophilaceae archaeon]
MNDPTPKEMQLQIDALKAEVKTLKEFVRALYSMIADDDDDYDDGGYPGGAEVGRFNT